MNSNHGLLPITASAAQAETGRWPDRKMMKIRRNGLLESLPLVAGDMCIRKWCRDDVDRRAAWPKYQKAYAAFNGAIHRLSPNERDGYFKTRDEDANRITLAVDRVLAVNGQDLAKCHRTG